MDAVDQARARAEDAGPVEQLDRRDPVLLAALLGGYLWLVADPFELTVARTGAPAVHDQQLPMPTGSEIRLARARRLYAQGELRAALALLEAGEVDEGHAASVNELRTTIQRHRAAEMRCPKCQYISFETGERCRNCGYEFSLVVDNDQIDIDVKIARDEPASSRGRDGTFSALDTPLNPPSERGVGRSLARSLCSADDTD